MVRPFECFFCCRSRLKRPVVAVARRGALTSMINYYRAMIPMLMGWWPKAGWESAKIKTPTLILWVLAAYGRSSLH